MMRAYLWQRRRWILLNLLFIAIFALCFYFMDASLALIWYPSALCLTLGCLYALWNFLRFRNRHLYLMRLAGQIDETDEVLPAADGVLEKDYQCLVRTIFMARRKEEKESRERIWGNLEYITLWAHQIKTPITAMQLLLQELTEENALSRRGELLEKLFEVEQYVDVSLQYMRLDTMTKDLLLKPYPLFGIVRQAVKYFARTFISKKISLRMEEADVLVATDEKWLLFVIKQILSNALKYTQEGAISIFMHPGKEKALVIEDTGIGIAAEDLPRIFERGFTGENGREQKKSTGIGLYLSKMILGRLGHGIVISSEEGNGTRVELLLAKKEIV